MLGKMIILRKAVMLGMMTMLRKAVVLGMLVMLRMMVILRLVVRCVIILWVLVMMVLLLLKIMMRANESGIVEHGDIYALEDANLSDEYPVEKNKDRMFDGVEYGDYI